MKIAALQFSDNEERINFWTSKNVSVINIDLTNINDFDVLFWHTTDVAKLTRSQQSFFGKYIGWKIAYTGEQGIPVKIDEINKIVNTLSWQAIQENYDDFKVKLSNNKGVVDAIEALGGLDKKLESYLKPFAWLSPFALISDEVQLEGNIISVQEAKQKLQGYIAKSLSKL